MGWEPIVYCSKADEWVEVTILEEGVRLRIRKGEADASARIATLPWEEWEKLVAIIKATHP